MPHLLQLHHVLLEGMVLGQQLLVLQQWDECYLHNLLFTAYNRIHEKAYRCSLLRTLRKGGLTPADATAAAAHETPDAHHLMAPSQVLRTHHAHSSGIISINIGHLLLVLDSISQLNTGIRLLGLRSTQNGSAEGKGADASVSSRHLSSLQSSA